MERSEDNMYNQLVDLCVSVPPGGECLKFQHVAAATRGLASSPQSVSSCCVQGLEHAQCP